MRRYEQWVADGKPDMNFDNMRNELLDEPDDLDTLENVDEPSDTSMTIDGVQGKVVSFFIPDDNPSAMHRVDATSQNTSSPSTSFSEVALKRLDEIQKRPAPLSNVPRRRKVNPLGSIVTNDSEFERAAVENKVAESRKQKPPKKENIKPIEENLVDVDTSASSNEDSDDEFNSEFPPTTTFAAVQHLASVWQNLNPPNEQDQLLGKLVGVIWRDGPRSYFFVGKILARFLDGEGVTAKSFQIECLKNAPSAFATTLEETPQHLEKDIALFPAYDIICGPFKSATALRGRKWDVPEYPKAFETFKFVKSIDRKKEYDRIYE